MPDNEIPKIKLSSDEEETLKKALLDMVEEGEEFQAGYRKEHEKYMRMYLAQPETETKDWPWTDAANMFAPVGRVVMEGMMSQIFDSMFSQDPMIKVTGTEDSDQRAAEDLTLFYNEYVWNKVLNIKEIANDWIFDTLLGGTGIVNVRWDKTRSLRRFQETEQRTVVETVQTDLFGATTQFDQISGIEEVLVEKARVENVNRPVVDNFDILRLFVPTDASTTLEYPGTRWYFTEHYLTEDQVLSRQKHGYRVTDELLTQLRSNPFTDLENEERKAFELATGRTPDTTRLLQFHMRWPLTTGFIEVGYDGEEKERKQKSGDENPYEEEVVVAFWWDTKQIARVVPLGRVRDDGRRGHISNRLTRLPRFFYGLGLMAKLEMMNDLVNTSLNQMIDYGTLQNIPFYFFEPVISGLSPADFPIEPGGGIPVQDASGVKFPRFQGNAEFFNTLINQAQTFTERDSAVTDFILGRQSSMPNAPRTARGQAMNVQQSNVSFARMVAMHAEQFKDLFRMVHADYSRHIDPEFTFSFFNRDSQALSSRTVLRSSFQSENIDFDFIINPNRQSEIDTNMALYNLLTAYPLIFQQPSMVRQLAREVWTSLGKKGFDQFWPEDTVQANAPGVGLEGLLDPEQLQPPTPEPPPPLSPEEENVTLQ